MKKGVFSFFLIIGLAFLLTYISQLIAIQVLVGASLDHVESTILEHTKESQEGIRSTEELEEIAVLLQDQDFFNRGTRTYFLSDSGELLYMENPVIAVRERLQGMAFITFLLFIASQVVIFREFNRKFAVPIIYLQTFIKKELYNGDSNDIDPIMSNMIEMQDVIRGVKELIHEFTYRNQLLVKQNEMFQKKSYTDALTKLNNRASLDEILRAEPLSPDSTLSIMLIDIDFFKQYNDTYGHIAGDEVLRTIASLFSKVFFEPNDFWARYGGEEFAVILRHTPLSIALKVAERFRQAVEDLDLVHDGSAISNHVSCSIGIASTIPGIFTEYQVILEIADAALYLSKQRGRNQVSMLSLKDRYVSPLNIDTLEKVE